MIQLILKKTRMQIVVTTMSIALRNFSHREILAISLFMAKRSVSTNNPTIPITSVMINWLKLPAMVSDTALIR
jgi:hypothetical protein